MTARRETDARFQRILELHRKGITPPIIALRLGMRREAVYAAIRRAKAQEVAR
jgi:DNA-binding CsgD family transcriptional regulator